MFPSASTPTTRRFGHSWFLGSVLLALLVTGCKKAGDRGTPLLWKIEGKSAHLFGTIHLPDGRLARLRDPVRRALEESDVLVTEIPMDPATRLEMTRRIFLPDGRQLADVLPVPDYVRLEKFFEKKKLPLAPLSRLKIWAMSTQLAMVDHLARFATHRPLDQILHDRAKEAGKQLESLETIEEQIGIFDSLSVDEQVHLLRNTLDQMDRMEKQGVDPVDRILQAYQSGDEKRLLGVLLENFDGDDPLDRKMKKRLFTDRNLILADRIAERLGAPGAGGRFFALGAGHLVGADGVVELLRDRGYRVTRVGKFEPGTLPGHTRTRLRPGPLDGKTGR